MTDQDKWEPSRPDAQELRQSPERPPQEETTVSDLLPIEERGIEHLAPRAGRATLLIVGVLVLCAAPAAAQYPDYTDVVATVKQELEVGGVPLAGACGAFRITNEVGRRTGLKLLRKTGGYRAVPQPDGSCLDGDHSALPDGYATDYLILLPQGVGFDLLGDGGGANTPQWGGPETDPALVARNLASWRDPLGAATVPPPVVALPPAPVVAPPLVLTPSTVELQALVKDLQQRLIDLQRSQDANEAAAAAFRASVKTEWQKIAPTLSFLGKYVVPAVSAWLIGKKF